MSILRHAFFLFVLAALCYLIAITITTGQVAFVVFLVAGMLLELVFWVRFWRQRRDPITKRA